MHDRIENGWNMFENHVFQFDFLNGDFVAQSKGGKVPDALNEAKQIAKNTCRTRYSCGIINRYEDF